MGARAVSIIGLLGAVGLLLTACAGGGAPTQPTAQAAATQAATAVKPAASPAATTVAAASPAAATAVTAASPAAATAVAGASPAAGTATAASPVRITGAQISPTDTTITLQNTSASAVDLAGWRLRVGSATATIPANSRVGPNDTATIHTASGTNAGRDIYLGQEAAGLISGLQPGASVALVNGQGVVAAEFTLPR